METLFYDKTNNRFTVIYTGNSLKKLTCKQKLTNENAYPSAKQTETMQQIEKKRQKICRRMLSVAGLRLV